MKVVVRLIPIVLLAAVGVWLWTIFFPSPEKIIRKQLIKLAADVSFSKNDGSLTKLAGFAGASSVGDFFTTNVDVNVDIPGYEQHTLAGRDEITQASLLARQRVASLSVKFTDINVTVALDKQSAVADVTVEVKVAGESDDFVQEAKVSFEKSERQWLISRVDTVRTIAQPALK